MPTYPYTCDEGHQYELVTSMDDDYSRNYYQDRPCEDMGFGPCGGNLRRVYSFAVKPAMQEHWNMAVGKPISNMGQMRSALAEKSEKDAERLGMPVNYQPVDWMDKETLGVTDEGLEVYDRSYARERSQAIHPSNQRTIRCLPPLPRPPVPPPAPSSPSPASPRR